MLLQGGIIPDPPTLQIRKPSVRSLRTRVLPPPPYLRYHVAYACPAGEFHPALPSIPRRQTATVLLIASVCWITPKNKNIEEAQRG
jgi:hypothetical protein